MRYTALCFSILIALTATAAGCNSPRYLIKGLTLPPGSEEIAYFTEGDNSGSVVQVGMSGASKRTATSLFDNSAGWDSVAAYFDRCMSRAGYEETTDEMGALLGEILRRHSDIGISDATRWYGKDGGKYIVILINSRVMEASDAGATSSAGIPDFELLVTESKTD